MNSVPMYKPLSYSFICHQNRARVAREKFLHWVQRNSCTLKTRIPEEKDQTPEFC
jgi:hypothetical protein